MEQKNNNLPANLSQPTQRALAGAGIVRLEQLATISEREIKQLHGIGPKSIRQLREALEAQGLSFAHEKSEQK